MMDDLEYGPITGAEFNGTNEVAIFLGRIREEFEAIDTLELAHLLETNGALLIDARETDEYVRGHVAGALNIPAGAIEFGASELDREKTAVVYGNDGWSMEAYAAADKLRTLFFSDVRVLSGGFAAWKRNGRVVEPGLKVACVSMGPH
ncbi:MAG TPA: rhodanese-like domain-containing protein [Thermodesulfobacteriota bacterium]